MDRGISRSAPYLPRYQSLSPARSPQLGLRRFSSQRSLSQPSQRIFYIGGAPSRVINSYYVHQSPSPTRTSKIHLLSSKSKHHLTRVTRSQSSYDINSSHLYTYQEDIFDKSTREAVKRRAGSCEDIYHKEPFFPDMTPSESGVSFGESEEGSAYGGDEDNVSQRSFDSSSAFCEVTVDSELDKCDSDNFSGPDCIGDRALSILRDIYLDESSEEVTRGQRQTHRELQSRNSYSTNPLSNLESRKREFLSSSALNVDKFHTEALSVFIPDGDQFTKTSLELNKVDDRSVMSSTPLAHSTPYVSPRGPEELKLHATGSWNADDPFGHVSGYVEGRKWKTERVLCDPESSLKHSSKLEDSSCNSSCSEDNYSDVSNITVSSYAPRKTKLVKKHSDKPASVKRSVTSYLRQVSGTMNSETDCSTKTTEQHVDSTLENVDCLDSGDLTSRQDSSDNNLTRLSIANMARTCESVNNVEAGNDWWAAYNINTTGGREVESVMTDNRDRQARLERDTSVAKPLTVNIPLISAGKHGQEKLRKLSQTSPILLTRSPNGSPILSPRETVQTLDSGMNENQIDENMNQTNIGEEHTKQHLRGVISSENNEYHQCHEREKEEGKMPSFTRNLEHDNSVTSVVAYDTTQCFLSGGQYLTNGKTLQTGQYYESVSQPCEHVQSKSHVTEVGVVLKMNDVSENTDTQFEGARISSTDNLENRKCKLDNSPFSENLAISSEAVEIVDTYVDINSTRGKTRSDNVKFSSSLSVQYKGSVATHQVIDSKNRDIMDHVLINNQQTEPQQGTWTGLDELDNVEKSQQDTPNKFSKDAKASLPAFTTQVSESSHRDGTSFSAGTSNHLDAGTSVSKTVILNEVVVLPESDVYITVLNGGNSVDDCEQRINDVSLYKDINKNNNNCASQGEFTVIQSSANIICLDSSNSLLNSQMSFTSDHDDSKISHVIESGEFVRNSQNDLVIDPVTGSNVIIESDQKQQSNSNIQRISTDNSDFTDGSSNMTHVIEPITKGNRSATEFLDTDQIVVLASVQITQDSVKNIDSPLHSVTHHLTSSLSSSTDTKDIFEREKTNSVVEESTYSNTQNNYDQQHLVNSSNVSKVQVKNRDNTKHSCNQQESLGTDNFMDIPTPVVEQSIHRPSDVAQLADKGINTNRYLSTEKNTGFVERKEFILSPSLFEEAVTVKKISNKRIEENCHRTTVENIVSTEQRILYSLPGVSSCQRLPDVNIVTDKSVTIKDWEYCTITTPDNVYSDKEKEKTVSSDQVFLDIHTHTSCVPVTSTSISSKQGSLNSAVSAQFSSTCLEDVSTSHLTDKTPDPEIDIMKSKSNNLNQHITIVDQVSPSVIIVSERFHVGEVATPAGDKFSEDMLCDHRLDNLHTQLSLISQDPSCTLLNASNMGDQYQEHAEATSILKQIVCGDTCDLIHFSNTSCESNQGDFVECFSMSDSSELNLTDEGSYSDSRAAKEYYDNDYDYVTTSLPKVSKTSRSHHQTPLLKPGHLKTSSLWTLQEETESMMDTLSPRPSRKLPRLPVASHDNISSQINIAQIEVLNVESLNVQQNQVQNSTAEHKTVTSDSSDMEGSDGNYSPVSNTDSYSCQSSSFERGQTPESESVAMVNDDNALTHQSVGNASTDSYYGGTFKEYSPGSDLYNFTSDLIDVSHINGIENSQMKSQMKQSESDIKTFKTSLAFCVSIPKMEKIVNELSPLDRLSASLEQFNTAELSTEGRKSFQIIEDTLSTTDYREINIYTSNLPTALSSNDDTASETSSFHDVDHDLSHASTSINPMSTDCSDNPMYTCTGTAEIKKISSFHYDLPAYSDNINHKPALIKTAVPNKEDHIREEKIKQFDTILDEFDRRIRPNVTDFIFLREKKCTGSTDSSASSSEDLYKTFSNEASEKQQNHVCIVVEDENMNTFRFKRFLKKSHTKRRKGRKLLRFLSKLGCVSENRSSTIGSPNLRMKRADENAKVYSTDSSLCHKPFISNPILISSTSFHHHDILRSSPVRNTGDCIHRFSSNRSLDSMRSRNDSAYSSISESVRGSLTSPAFHSVSSSSVRIPPASSGSVSSVFRSGSTSAGDWSFSDSVFSSNSEPAARSSSFSIEDDSVHHLHNQPIEADNEKISVLSDIFDQLNVCEDEIDSALLNRVRHGHTKVEVNKK